MACPIRIFVRSIALAFSLSLFTIPAWAQGSAFTYQGTLNNNNALGNGNFDFEFKLFDQLAGGAQQGATVQKLNVAVTNGAFSVILDFGANAFPGAARFLELNVRPAGGGVFTLLTPRQPITATPYAIKAANATAADGLSAACIGCVTSSQIQGGGAYIDNTTTQQAGANYNISGDGTAGGTLSGNIINAVTQFNLNGARVLSAIGTNNLYLGVGAGTADTGSGNSFVGANAGTANTTGGNNAFFGWQAGKANTTGGSNSFFGVSAGLFNTTGSKNSLFGHGAGAVNTTGENNSFFGVLAGLSNTTAGNNSFFGYQTGYSNATGTENSFFGEGAGYRNITGSRNSFFGKDAGFNTITGLGNVFFGASAGVNNGQGHGNVMLGADADFRSLRVLRSNESNGDNNLFLGRLAGASSTRRNATAIGSYAFADCSDCMVLGDSSTPAFKVGIGTNAPGFKLDISGNLRAAGSDSNDIQVETAGGANSWARFNMKTNNQTWTLGTSQNFNGDQFYLFDFTNTLLRMMVQPGGGAISFPTGNVGIGTTTPGFQLHVRSSSTPYMVYGEHLSSAGNVAGIAGSASNGSGVLGTSLTGRGVQGSAFSDGGIGVYGTHTGQGTGVRGESFTGRGVSGSSDYSYGVYGYSSNSYGVVGLSTFSYAGYFQGNVFVEGVVIEASDARLKQQVAPLGYGLRQILQLRPVSWNWKRKPDAGRQFGLIAQEVETILPELVSTEKDAEQTKGINYAGLTPVVINAIQEQQTRIETQQKLIVQQQEQIKQQQDQLDGLKRLVCRDHPKAELCRAGR